MPWSVPLVPILPLPRKLLPSLNPATLGRLLGRDRAPTCCYVPDVFAEDADGCMSQSSVSVCGVLSTVSSGLYSCVLEGYTGIQKQSEILLYLPVSPF